MVGHAEFAGEAVRDKEDDQPQAELEDAGD